MRIPDFIQQKLSEDQTLSGAVFTAIGILGPWMTANQVVFFPEYTDHSIAHVEDVLVTAETLMSEAAKQQFTAADSAVLVLATLLHDAGMHLSRDGFETLKDCSQPEQATKILAETPWPELWSEFYANVRRYDDKALLDMFGSTIPVQASDITDATDRGRKLIGEFLRRHHPRLAHEIALDGMPGPECGRLDLLPNLDIEMRDLVGLVARSHGLPLRSTFQALEDRLDIRNFNGVHAVYLMALLRIADYLQIQKKRAPSQALAVWRPRSPVSKREWNAHNAIVNITIKNEDPELITVRAKPQDIETYLRVKDWLSGIQSELDATWAALGEVYGRFEGLQDFGLRFRQIRSNLDDEAKFAKTVDFLPVNARFRAAGAELLQLLVGPLYGNRPGLAVRELIQNALDAVRERVEWEKQHPGVKLDLSTYEADVDVYLYKEDGSCWLKVSDKGIGMTLDTIVKYFLIAGASYRASEAWKRDFTDKDGHSKVLRSGRFGVGALSAFMLGEEIHVTTRHAGSPSGEGVSFFARLNNTPVQFTRNRNCGVGTVIRVRLDAAAEKELWPHYDPYLQDSCELWDFYCLTTPTVRRRVSSHTEIVQLYELPAEGADLPQGWRRIRHEQYSDIQWAYEHVPVLVMNGLWVGIPPEPNKRRPFRKSFFNVPCVSVFDRDGNLPLSLDRITLAQATLPFEEALHVDVIKDFIAYCLTNCPNSNLKDYKDDGNAEWYRRCYPGFKRLNIDYPTFRPYVYLSLGVTFIDPSFLRRARVASLLLFGDRTPRKFITSAPEWNHNGNAGVVLGLTETSNYNPLSWLARTLSNEAFGDLDILAQISGMVMILSSRMVGQLKFEPDRQLEPVYHAKPISIADCDALTTGECPNIDGTSIAKFAQMCNATDRDLIGIAAELYLKDLHVDEMSLLAKTWSEVTGMTNDTDDWVIPYDLTERRRKFAHVYKELAPYIARYENAE